MGESVPVALRYRAFLSYSHADTKTAQWLHGRLEGYRIGNSHMSYRAGRLFWVRYRPELFAGAVIVFWLAAIEAARHLRSDRSTET